MSKETTTGRVLDPDPETIKSLIIPGKYKDNRRFQYNAKTIHFLHRLALAAQWYLEWYSPLKSASAWLYLPLMGCIEVFGIILRWVNH